MTQLTSPESIVPLSHTSFLGFHFHQWLLWWFQSCLWHTFHRWLCRELWRGKQLCQFHQVTNILPMLPWCASPIWNASWSCNDTHETGCEAPLTDNNCVNMVRHPSWLYGALVLSKSITTFTKLSKYSNKREASCFQLHATIRVNISQT